jgi:hypothetical protein
MPRESGVSSTPRTFASITNASEYWIARFRGRRRPRVRRARIHQIRLHNPATRRARVVHIPSPRNQRAQGKPGARCTRSLAWCVKSTRVSHHRFTGTPGLPCAMVLTAYFALSPVTGLVCHRRPQETCKKLASRELDASVGASGPHDFAVRSQAPSSMRRPRPSHPRPTFVTIAKRPSVWAGMARDMWVIWVRRERKYFCEKGWTGGSVICPTGSIRQVRVQEISGDVLHQDGSLQL